MTDIKKHISEAPSSEALLDTFDPGWAKKYEEAQRDHDRAYNQGRSAETQQAILNRMQEAFWSQFRTATQLHAHVSQELADRALATGKVPVARPLQFQDDAHPTTAEILAWRTDALRELNVEKLPIGQPEGMTSFCEPLSEGATRSSFMCQVHESPGKLSNVQCTTEKTPNNMSVCFHELPNNKKAGIKVSIALLATAIRETFFAECEPEAMNFFIHIPYSVGDAAGEQFMSVSLKWDRNRYKNPEFTKHDCVPRAIRLAEMADDPTPPIPSTPASSPAFSEAAPRRVTFKHKLLNLIHGRDLK